MKKHKHEEHENHERWLISYADFITLLFAFFVVMYATSSVNEGKLRAVADAINSAFNPMITLSSTNIRLTEARVGNEMFEVELKLYKKIAQAVEAIDITGKSVSVARDRRGVIIRIADTVVFDPGQADILPKYQPTLDRISGVIADLPNSIQVEGHTDDVPISTARYPSNWELAAARATNMVRYLVEQRGLDPRRFSIGGYGQYRPIAGNDTSEGRGKNRRVDIVILTGPVTGAQPVGGELPAESVPNPAEIGAPPDPFGKLTAPPS